MERKQWLLSRVTLIVAICGFLLSFAMTFQSLGLSQGLNIGDKELDEYRESIGQNTIKFSVSGGKGCGTYCELAARYGLVSSLFLMVGAAAAFQRRNQSPRRKAIAGIVILTSSGFVLCILWGLIRIKQWVDEGFWEAPRNAFAQLTITFDWVLVPLTIMIASLQMALLFSFAKEFRSIAR